MAGATGFPSENDVDAQYHVLSPNNSGITQVLECSDIDWLREHVRAELTKLKPFADAHTPNRDYRSKKTWRAQNLYGIAFRVDRPFAKQYLKQAALNFPLDSGDLYITQFHDDPCCDPVIDAIVEYTEKHAPISDPPSVPHSGFYPNRYHYYKILQAIHYKKPVIVFNLIKENPLNVNNDAVYLFKLGTADLVKQLFDAVPSLTLDQKTMLQRMIDMNAEGHWPPPDQPYRAYCPQ